MPRNKLREKVDCLLLFTGQPTYVNERVMRPALANLLASLANARSSDVNGENDETTKAKLKSIAEQLGALLSETPTDDPNVSGGQVSQSFHPFAKIR